MDLLYLGPAETGAHVRASLPAHFTVCHAVDEAAVDRAIGTCEAVLDASLKVRFAAERLAQARRLKVFVTVSTGSDHVDQASLEQRGIPLLTLRGQHEVLRNVTPTAEHAWLLLLACARRLRAAHRDVLEGGWHREDHPGVMLRGKTLGIIGCGRLGQWVARYGTAFGMRCVGHDPHVRPWPEGIESMELATLLQTSDFISVHVPYSDETRRLLGPREFGQLKPGAILVNTSRGGVIDERALLAALTSGRLAAAGLDVLTGEPDIKTHPIVEYARTHENVLITPHIGGFSPDALIPLLTYSCERIARFFQAQDARTALSPSRTAR